MSADSVKVIAENRKARFDYVILDTYEAGLQLLGSELKPLRAGEVNFSDSYISFVGQEAFWQNGHIRSYPNASFNDHRPDRLRKLLLKRQQLDEIFGRIRLQGLTCVPLKIYFKGSRAKMLIGLAKGKTKGDKRQTIKNREASKEIQRVTRKDRQN